MKFILPALAVLGLVSAAPSEPVFVKRASDSCAANTLSCHTSGTINTCCSPKYGLLAFDMQWIVGYGPSDAFTIHGLWPDTCSGGQLSSSGCDTSRTQTDIASIIGDANSSLLDRMNNYWVSYTGDNNAFWVHEWNKHGTCVSTLDPSCYGSSYVANEDVVDYFETVVDLRDQFDIYSALSSNGITAGGSYATEAIRSAIQKVYGAKAKLDCASGALTDVTINFYVKGKSTYQITDVLSAGSCKGTISLPSKY
ncbi:unnamed protein product [Mucor hiemalis]